MIGVCGDNPVCVGGFGNINFGKQYRQGNRVYSSNHIGMACLSQPVGNTGGNSYLYLVYDDFNSNVRNDQSTIGTITTNIGNNAFRNGQKLIERVNK